MNKEFFCLCCQGNFESEEYFDKHGCNPIFKMIGGTLTVELSQAIKMKRTRWGRFKDHVLSMDISLGLAFMGLVIMNCVLIRHINLTFTECLIESLSWGFAIPRLIK